MRRIGLVPIASLKTGDNKFELEGEPRDFGYELREVRENPSFRKILGEIRVTAVITRSGQRFLVRGRVHFKAKLTCAICGDDYEQDFDEEMTAEFTSIRQNITGYARELEPEELDRLPIDSDFIDLTAMVRDTIHLVIPIAPRCRDDCRGLCPWCGVNLNQGRCRCSDEKTVGCHGVFLDREKGIKDNF